MSPPIYTPDGSEVSEIVLPDGSTASEVIGPDGNVVFEAGPDIPDTSMFQSPILQWVAIDGINVSDGQATDGWVDALGGVTATDNGTPTFRADKSGFAAVEYNGASDYHSIPSGNLPTGDGFSFAATVFTPVTHFGVIISYGYNNNDAEAFNLRLNDNGEVMLDLVRSANASGGFYPTNQWFTVGGSIAEDGSEVFTYLNGSQVGNDTASVTANIQDNNQAIGSRDYLGDLFLDGSIYDLVVSNSTESQTAFSDYHQARLG